MADPEEKAQALQALRIAAGVAARATDGLEEAVGQARRAGASWTEVASALGLSRSTTHFRYRSLGET